MEKQFKNSRLCELFQRSNLTKYEACNLTKEIVLREIASFLAMTRVFGCYIDQIIFFAPIAQRVVVCFSLIVFCIGCKKESNTTKLPPGNISKKVFIVGEGSLGNGNATLGLYDVDSNNIYEDVFAAINNQSLGDVFQSITLMDDKFFLCINNSDKIVVIKRNDYKLQGIINIPKPRYILSINSQKAYVSTIFSDKIYVINPQTLQVTGSFSLPSKNPEMMLLWNNEAIVCCWDTAVNKIYFVDINTDAIKKSVIVSGKAPQECLMDKDGKLWILSGDVYNKTDATFTKLDPVNGTILKSYFFPKTTDVIKPVFNHAKDSLYFIEVQYDGSAANNGVYRMNINANDLPVQPFIAAKSFQYFWSVGIEPGTGNIFIGDPKGFTQKGAVSIYQPDGTFLKEFKTGVGPARFYFDY